MRTYRVLVMPRVLKKMDAIRKYIAEELCAPVAAERMYSRIAEAVLSLEKNPERCHTAFPGRPWAEGLRRMNVARYALFFRIRDEQVEVVDMLYAASDLERRLREDTKQE